jgi:hypothetical protein
MVKTYYYSSRIIALSFTRSSLHSWTWNRSCSLLPSRTFESIDVSFFSTVLAYHSCSSNVMGHRVKTISFRCRWHSWTSEDFSSINATTVRKHFYSCYSSVCKLQLLTSVHMIAGLQEDDLERTCLTCYSGRRRGNLSRYSVMTISIHNDIIDFHNEDFSQWMNESNHYGITPDDCADSRQ